jgi:hypothetical protein
MTFHGLIERFVLALAAASGLITAAAISGLPSAQCAALADTYGVAILSFGVIAICCLLAAAALTMVESEHVIWKIPKRSARMVSRVWIVFGTLIFLYSLYHFIFSAQTGQQNLRRAIQHCLVGTEAELAARRNQRIEMLNSSNWWRAESLIGDVK